MQVPSQGRFALDSMLLDEWHVQQLYKVISNFWVRVPIASGQLG